MWNDFQEILASMGLNTQMTLFEGFRLRYGIRRGLSELSAAEEELRRIKEYTALSVMGCYLQALLTRELMDQAGQQVSLSEGQVEQARLQVEAGKLSESELLDARAALAERKMQETQARNNRQLALLELAQAMRYEDEPQSLRLLPWTDTLALDQVYQGLYGPREIMDLALDQRPAVRVAEHRLEGSDHAVRQAQAARYPALSLSGGYSNSYYYNHNLEQGLRNKSLAQQWKQNGAENLGLSLSIPIYNRRSVRNQIRSAQLEVENAKVQLEKTKQALQKEVEQAYYNATLARDTYLSALEAVEAAQAAFDLEQKKFEAGRSNSYRYDQALQRLSQARSQALQAKYSCLLRLRILDWYRSPSPY